MLAAQGWLTADGQARVAEHASGEGTCSLPAKLLAESRLGAQPVLLYCLLQLVPGYDNQSGLFTYGQLNAMAPISPESARLAERKLVIRGWLQVEREGYQLPIRFRLRDPDDERVRALLIDMKHRLNAAPHLGKAVLREYLSQLIDTDHYLDDAAMAFLFDHTYLEQLMLDRYYYRDNVALQLDEPLDSSMFGARKQRRQQAFRLQACDRHDVTILLVRPSDLSWAGLKSLLDGRLQIRRQKPVDRVISFLDSAAEAYRQSLTIPEPAGQTRRRMLYRSVSKRLRWSASSW